MMNNELINRELLLQAIQAIATTDKTLISMGAGVGDITAFTPTMRTIKNCLLKCVLIKMAANG